jgi:ADP-ribose pyrophosphatase
MDEAETTTLYEGKWLRLRKQGQWEYAERTNEGGLAVIVIAATPDRRVLFVEQYRVPVGARTIEMPAGIVGDIHAGESLELAAERELLEETGWQAAKIELLMIGPTSAGMSSERVAFVRATGLTKVHDGGGDESEDIIVHEIPADDVPAWLAQKAEQGFEMDLKLWAGLWMLDRNPDGSAA